MTQKERMLAAIQHKQLDQIPFAPRMDLWYIANRANGLLPHRFEGKNTVEIAKELDVACHAVRADYTLPRSNEDLMFRAFGVDNHPDYPYRVELKGVPIKFEADNENFKTWIDTPSGELFVHIKNSREMQKDGISIPFVISYPIKNIEDLDAVAWFFEHLEVVPTPDNYLKFQNRIGDQGLAIANGLPVASPIHLLLHDLMPMDKFYYAYIDYPDKLYQFAKRIETFFEKALNAVLESNCEAFLWGSNYDESTTYPAFFEKEILPWLQKVSKKASKKGKYVVTHADGENHDLLHLYPKSGIHITESVTPYPMTKCTLKEIRAGMGESITIYGGIPAIVLLENSMDDTAFKLYMEKFFSEEIGDGTGLILGVADNVPPRAKLERIQEINTMVKNFGSVPKNMST